MSKVIKSHYYITLDETKRIDVADFSEPNSIHTHTSGLKQSSEQESAELLQARQMQEQILRDAESVAEAQIRSAMDEAAAMMEMARVDIDGWWEERRNLDQQVEDESRRIGYEEGYQAGLQQAEEQVRIQYEDMLKEAKAVLEQAYDMKRQIIKESEPFLIELSTAIAEKIIQHELRVSPEWVISMIRSVLSRKREKGMITLCVSPEQFAYIRDARDELLLSVDSQAELQILPDSTVGANGCVVRTAFGSMDARVDTQLKEIKLALQQLSMESSEGAEEE